jgi:hypothetical protein
MSSRIRHHIVAIGAIAIVSVVCVLSLVVAAQAQAPAASAITVRRAVEVPQSSGAALISVEYSYNFAGAGVVHVDGFGDAPEAATLAYLTRDRTIRIRRRDGTILGETQIGTPQKSAGASTDIQTSFPAGFELERPYRGQQLFAVHLSDVMQTRFPAGTERLESDGFSLCRSPYKTLIAGRLQVRISVVVSFPYKRGDSQWFKVAYRVEERPSHDVWRDTLTQKGEELRDTFLTELVRALEGAP